MICLRCLKRLVPFAAVGIAVALLFGAVIPMARLAWAGRYGFAY